MSKIAKILPCEVRWQYFATSHGKGVVDGINGAAKSAVRRRLLSKNGPVVQCAKDFVKEVRRDLQNVKVVEVLEHEIGQNESMWEDVENVAGIKSVHCIAFSNGTCKLYPTSYEFEKGIDEIAEIEVEETMAIASISTLAVGDWVAVRYNADISW
ncbi:(S)-beta-bisabolene synthase [Plakobranchus ocellatus]|uniref:(S)-beta-bisabolene synthase n=1 Tax=Plakobranchus ocellatus TaxID=259542 RepID=A0AAV4DIZ0_9GAST|nr:(S)-beta-bisabolene synthase [Plakobranchus ocellatus]